MRAAVATPLWIVLFMYWKVTLAFQFQTTTFLRRPSTRNDDGTPSRTDDGTTLMMMMMNRRQWLVGITTAAAGTGFCLGTHPPTSRAAAVAPETDFFRQPIIEVDLAKDRFVQARAALQDLIHNFDAIVAAGGGDAVRNKLGTQGVSSPLYGIPKIVKILQAQAEDIVEYTEAMEEFNAYLYQAEGAAYQSLFAEHSSAKSTPASLLQTSKQDLMQMLKYMDILAEQLHL